MECKQEELTDGGVDGVDEKVEGVKKTEWWRGKVVVIVVSRDGGT